jgi:glycyl-tRNA synthetase beta chain
MQTEDFLFEIGCEELPIAAVKRLSESLEKTFAASLEKHRLSYDRIQSFASPRRLAVVILRLALKQASFSTERIGPGVESAYAKDGSPSIAFLGFAKSCGVSIDRISTKETPRGKKLYCIVETSGQTAETLLPNLITEVVYRFSVGKTMRWGNFDYHFARPVHWVVAMLGRQVIPVKLFGICSADRTFGHRFHAPESFSIDAPASYAHLLLNQAFVVPNFDVRKKLIHQLAVKQAKKQGELWIDEVLLNEVTALVEWPVAYLGRFNPDFLNVPKEALIASMKIHQRCFPVVGQHGKLLPYFVIISNIDSKRPKTVIEGNNKVINARLADAAFFYQKDIQHTLESRVVKLESILFHEKLGSLWDRVKRLIKSAEYLANVLRQEKVVVDCVRRAALLSKSDLTSELVYEFSELQGMAGYYYARHDRESVHCAKAIRDQYKPICSGGMLPERIEGQILAIADKLDTLTSMIGLNQLPSGDKDPFALRRAAMGMIRIVIDAQLSFDLKSALNQAYQNFTLTLPNADTVNQIFEFILQRLKSWYADQGVSSKHFASVYAANTTDLVDFDRRLKAVLLFAQRPEANSLSSANKRVLNILKKQHKLLEQLTPVDTSLFEAEAEKSLWHHMQNKAKAVKAFVQQKEYTAAFNMLAELKAPVDTFFDHVLVMANDKKLKNNRLALLSQLRALFVKIADIAYLS